MSLLRQIQIIALVYVAGAALALTLLSVGGRGQDSTVVVTATPATPSSPALVPAPNNRAVGEMVVGGVGELADPPSSGAIPDDGALVRAGSSPAPASTVTQSALTATVQAYLVIDPVPATPPTQRVPVGSYAPWPEYLWPVVACLVGRESGGNPGAVGGQGERGLMQIGVANFAYLATYGITPDMLFDGPTNIRAGWIISLYWQKATGDGFAPWASTRGGCA